jgi:hypothetical protein
MVQVLSFYDYFVSSHFCFTFASQFLKRLSLCLQFCAILEGFTPLTGPNLPQVILDRNLYYIHTYVRHVAVH